VLSFGAVTPEGAPLVLRFLGPMAVERDGVPLELPQSKKTRALLAYLVVTGRAHRRERLCELLWDVVDDPRAALRWCLSKLRQVVDDEHVSRIVATRAAVRFDAAAARVDVLALRAAVATGLASTPTDELIELAESARGELLEGLDLSDFHGFQAWCVAERAQARAEHQRLLGEIVHRLRDAPSRALPFARTRVSVDPLDEPARVDLLRIAFALGHLEECEEHYEAGVRLSRELGGHDPVSLRQAWLELRGSPRVHASSADEPSASSPPTPTRPSNEAAQDEPPARPRGLFGRDTERAELVEMLDDVVRKSAARAAIITGEPGIGKSRLLDELVSHARSVGMLALRGRAFELEGNRPYGPWRDALMADEGADSPWRAIDSDEDASRERLFVALAGHVATLAEGATGVVLIFDDVQWLDRDSFELLHYVARTHRDRPLGLVISARQGELDDNGAAVSFLRSLRREVRVSEIELRRLTRDATRALIAADGDELEAVYRISMGNPLFALEIARARRQGLESVPGTILELVRERLERIPAPAADVLRWACVLGSNFSLELLASLVALSEEALVDALEALERHGLVTLPGLGMGSIAHELVRAAVYGGLSDPRRRLMHHRVATGLASRGPGVDRVAQLAHHAVRAADPILAVSACAAAGEQALRLFAYADAESLAKRGLTLASALPEPDRTRARVDLLRVRLAARKPTDPEGSARELEGLAQLALDHGLVEHARLAFHMLAYLRWEHGSIADARRYMLEAERVSRSADPRERAVALAEAARCLVLLERDLPQAEAFALEAKALAERGDVAASVIPCAIGMLQAFRGEDDPALASLSLARELAQQEGDRLGEFRALEGLTMLELDRGRYPAAHDLARELQRLGERVSAGSEGPMAAALMALATYACSTASTSDEIDVAVDALRAVDAKYRLAFVSSRTALLAAERGAGAWAHGLAEVALAAATALGRPSEVAFARAAMARVKRARAEPAPPRLLEDLAECASGACSARARALVKAVVKEHRP
jgi:DNA-binding SARP family transcriptional activator